MGPLFLKRLRPAVGFFSCCVERLLGFLASGSVALVGFLVSDTLVVLLDGVSANSSSSPESESKMLFLELAGFFEDEVERERLELLLPFRRIDFGLSAEKDFVKSTSSSTISVASPKLTVFSPAAARLTRSKQIVFDIISR